MRAPANPHDGAIGQHHLQAQHVIRGDPVFEAARPAGVGGNIAADATFRATGRIRRIIQPTGFHFFLQLTGNDPGLNDGDKVVLMNFPNAPHAGHGQRNAAVHRHASAHVTHPARARGDRNAVAFGKPEDSAHRFRRTRQSHRIRQTSGEPFVAGMRGQRGFVQFQFPGRQALPQGFPLTGFKFLHQPQSGRVRRPPRVRAPARGCRRWKGSSLPC